MAKDAKKKPALPTRGGGKPAAPSMSRIEQLKRSFQLGREHDSLLPWKMAGIFVGIIVLGVVVGSFIGHPVYCGILGVSLGLLATTFYFGRVVSAAVNIKLEGQVGGAAGALQGLRRGWTVDPGISATRNQDMVHRAIGPAGIVLVAEGAPSRVGHLLANEKRKHSRVAPDTPIYDIVAGNDDGQVPIKKLMSHVTKLPRNLTGAQITEVKQRMKALEATRQPVPLPKGPMPKNVKLPKGALARDAGTADGGQRSGKTAGKSGGRKGR